MYCPDCLLPLSCPSCPTLALAPQLYWCCCPSVAAMSWLVLSILPRLTCPSCLVYIDLFWLSCLSGPVPAVRPELFCLGFPFPVALSCLSCLACPVPPGSCSSCPAPVHNSPAPESGHCCHVLASRPLCPVLPELSRLTCQATLSRLICLGFPVQRHSQCHVQDVMPQLYCHGCQGVPSQLSCPISVVLSQPTDLSFCYVIAILHPVLSFFSCLYYPDILRLSCPDCPAQAFLSQLSCASILVPSSFSPLFCIWCHAFIALSYLSCPTCPVLEALASKSYTDCPVLNVLSWLSRPSLHGRSKCKELINKWKNKLLFQRPKVSVDSSSMR